jgi:hypothetical protein
LQASSSPASTFLASTWFITLSWVIE